METGLTHVPKLPPPIRYKTPSFLSEGTTGRVPLANAKLVITGDMVAQASLYVRSGATVGKVVEWRDVRQMGLVLRLQSKSATWLLRRRKNTFTIGSIDEFSVLTARSLAASAIHVDELKSDARRYIERMRHIIRTEGQEAAYYYDQKFWIDVDGTLNGAENPMPEDHWTWAHLRAQFVAFMKLSLCETWAPQYERIMYHPAFAAIEHKFVCNVTLDELVDVKVTLKKQLPNSQAARALNQAKAMLTWAYNEHPKRTGMNKNTNLWWLPLSISSKTKRRYRSPSITELVRTIILVEHLSETGGRGGRKIAAGMVGALWAVVLTGQRIGHLLKSSPGRIFEHPDLPSGWKVINWTADEMKPASGEALPHSLPLPAEVIDIIDRYRRLAGPAGDRWMFPSGTHDTCVSNAGLENLLRRLNGNGYWVKRHSKGQGPGRKGPRQHRNDGRTRHQKPSLLAENGIDKWTPHDARRSLQSFCDDNDLGGAGSAILAHREGRKNGGQKNEEERALPTTEIHYSRGQKIPLKLKGMKRWVDAVLATYKTERNRFDAELSKRMADPVSVDERPLDDASSAKRWRMPTVGFERRELDDDQVVRPAVPGDQRFHGQFCGVASSQ